MTLHPIPNCGEPARAASASSASIAADAVESAALTGLALPALRRASHARHVCLVLALTATFITACGNAPTAHTSAGFPLAIGTRPGTATCLDTAELPPPPRALRMAGAAQQELALWGSPSMDAEGRLTQSGPSEVEDEPRNGPGALAPWQRVLGYWRGVDPASARLPYLVRYGTWRPADRGRLQADLTQAATARTQALGAGAGVGDGVVKSADFSVAAIDALRIAVDRIAVVDTPWSAAFISWLAREAGLADDEFTFSEAHADYARAGFTTRARETAGVPGDRQVLRACALVHTPPRVGDMVCHARGRSADIDSFDSLGAELTENPLGATGVPMHCDIVVAVDSTGFDTIGGNVLQAVTQRRLAFAAGTRMLDASYQPGDCKAGGVACVDRHMSRQPWSLLLQWR